MKLSHLTKFCTVLNLLTVFSLCLCRLGQARPVTGEGQHRQLQTVRHRDLAEGSADDSAADLLTDLESPDSNDVAEHDAEGTGTAAAAAAAAQAEEFHLVPMPTDFKSYDVLVADGFISMDELVHVTGAVENVKKAFRASDANDDGLLTETEFYAAPWVLGGDLTVEDADEPPIDSAVASNVHAASSKAIDKVKPTGKLSGDVTENISHSRHPDD